MEGRLRVPDAADEGEVEVAVPAEHHTPREVCSVAAGEAEVGEELEDALAADESPLVLGSCAVSVW
jgi:hypothetical protein